MSMIGNFQRATDEEIAQLLAQPDRIHAFQQGRVQVYILYILLTLLALLLWVLPLDPLIRSLFSR